MGWVIPLDKESPVAVMVLNHVIPICPYSLTNQANLSTYNTFDKPSATPSLCGLIFNSAHTPVVW